MNGPKEHTVDKDLRKINLLQSAAQLSAGEVGRLGLGLLFLLAVLLFVAVGESADAGSLIIIAAAVIGGFMALNIGANDVASNIAPSVGSKTLTMAGALAIAAVLETAGALIAGGDVIETVAGRIINPHVIGDAAIFVWAMMAALLAAALCVVLASWMAAPVSTTHAIMGGIMGAGIAAAGHSAVNWAVTIGIAGIWVISPVLGGLTAAAILFAIKKLVIFQEDRQAAARKWVPVFIAIMVSACSVYLVMKALKDFWTPGADGFIAIGAGSFVISWLAARAFIRRVSATLDNRRKSLRKLFALPLILSAAFLSFAHGANDVANAVGPVAAIVRALNSSSVGAGAAGPLWVILIGTFGISAGLIVFGPKLINTVGGQIAKLDAIRAYAVALSAAIIVILASSLGLPVSSTHIVVGGIFGVGFLREYFAVRKPGAKPRLRSRYKRLVRRSYFLTIIAAWLITVPLAALIGAAIFYLLAALFVS